MWCHVDTVGVPVINDAFAILNVVPCPNDNANLVDAVTYVIVNENVVVEVSTARFALVALKKKKKSIVHVELVAEKLPIGPNTKLA